MRKLLALVLALALCLALAVPALAAEIVDDGTCGGNLTWTMDSDGTLTISGTGPMTDYVSAIEKGDYNQLKGTTAPWRYRYREKIKFVIIEDGVTSIGNYAFFSCANLTGVSIPDSVASIGNGAFEACRNLESVTIPDSVASIGNMAFRYCAGMKRVSIPGSVASIGSEAFSGCTSLTGLTLPDGVASIGSEAFQNCNKLTSVNIPGSVSKIEDGAFAGCNNLTRISVDPNSRYYCDIDGVLFSKDKTELLCHPNAKAAAGYIIPDGVVSIMGSAFSSCGNLKSVTIPDSVTRIGNEAFLGCFGLSSVIIPDSVTSIGDYAFWNCAGLETVSIGGSVSSIGNSAFEECRILESVTIPDSVAVIGDKAFYSCWNLASVSLGIGVAAIGKDAFGYCVLHDAYYSGSEAQWNVISIDEGNQLLLNSIHYGSTEPAAPVSVSVNGAAVAWTDAKPFIDEHNRTMVPLRAVADALGLTVAWDEVNREASFTDGTKTITFPIGSIGARTSDIGHIWMDTSAVIVSDRTYAPIRYLAEYFGHTVGWDAAAWTVIIQ